MTASHKSALAQAYRQMMQRIQHSLHHHEHQSTRSTLAKALDWAREQAVTLGEIGQEDARNIANYVYRDLKDLADHLHAAEKDHAAWLHMDLELVEAEIWDLLTSVADTTRVELAALEAQANAYYSGEIAGPGSLCCDACGHVVDLASAEPIPDCPECGGQQFHRITRV